METEMDSTSSRKLRTRDAAHYLRISSSTLAKMRLRGDGPPYSLAGRRVILYDQHDLDEWLGRTRRVSTRGARDAA
jgi:hypothetical protein